MNRFLLLLALLASNLAIPALAQTEAAGSAISIIPAPVSLQAGSGFFVVNPQTKLVATEPESRTLALLLKDFVLEKYGFSLSVVTQIPASNFVQFSGKEAQSIAKEGYGLTVTKSRVVVRGQGAGLFYGLQSLFQLFPVDGKPALPAIEVEDFPRFEYRGVMLDAGRYMMPVSLIKKMLDQMAYYKMNRFHWHLTEDQGWRMEIKKYPKLTQISAYRDETIIGHPADRKPPVFDGIRHGGFYTQDEARDVVRYATEHHITVIPEIEMPGHSGAALVAYPELGCNNPPTRVSTTWGVHKEVFCPNEVTFRFLEDVLTEVMAIFPSTYIHIGGDECPKDRWKESAFCQDLIKREGLKDEHELQSWFIRRIEKFLNSKGRKLIGWDEILEGGLAPNATVMSWRGEDGGIAAARQKHDVIMTPYKYMYTDLYQVKDFRKEPIAIRGYLNIDTVYNYNPVPAVLNW